MSINIEKLTWEKFQDLCIDILKEEGWTILRRSGVGPDRSMDVLVSKQIEYAPGCTNQFIWLVQCKHKSNNKSLKPPEVGDFVSDIPRHNFNGHNANGYWLMTNVYLSTGLEDKIVSVNNDNAHRYKATYSNVKDLEDFLYKYRELLKKYSITEHQTKNKKIDWQKANPYKELQPYNESDKDFFFGRDKETEELLTRIYKYKIVGLFGESGTGKTSLVNAGIIPNLKKENYWIVSVRCLDEPIKRIREAVIKVLKENNISEQSIEKLVVTNSFPQLIIELKSIIEKENKNLIIVIDQLEEIFTRAQETEREQLSKGITESLIGSPLKGKISFLLSLREDYIGELWEWSHKYNLEDAWVHSYRISRLDEEKAYESIVEPLHKLGIKVDDKFIHHLIADLKRVGDGLIYPPYLQIVCSKLFEVYKNKNSQKKSLSKFDKNLYEGTDGIELLIADYLSESMLEGLTEEEKLYAQNILDLLTGPEGLRTFLNLDEIARYIGINKSNAQHVIEHLTKKKIVRPLVEKDNVMGYELVHDFLSKKFFEKLGPEAKKAKTTIEIFRKAFKEWSQHGVLASKDRLEILFDNIKQLSLNDEEWTFLIKSSFSVYWYFENKWTTLIEQERLANICMSLLHDKEEGIIENSISTLGKIKGKEITLILKEIIESSKTVNSIKDAAINQFSWNIYDIRILDTLKNIIKNGKEFKLRKSAVFAFASNVNHLSKSDKNIVDKEIGILYEALNDSMTQVRKQVADVLGYTLVNKKSVKPLIERLKNEISISSRKAIIIALCVLLRKGESVELISPILKKISSDAKEDYRVREEAKLGLTQ